MTISPGQAKYKVQLKDHDGTLLAEFDNWVSLSFVHHVNQRGNIRFEINGDDDRISLFTLDRRLEVWRKNPVVDLEWYKEWEGFYRTNNDVYQNNDNNTFVAYGFSYLDLARRAHIMYPSGSSGATKSDAAETVMREFVKENIGEDATVANGRQADNVMPNFTVGVGGGNGPTWDDTATEDNLLSTLQDISLFTTEQEDTIDFDIVSIGDDQFGFATYNGQRGLDRTEGNPDGRDAVTFSLGFGNMIAPVLTEDRTNEVTAVYGLGRGTDDSKQVELVESLAKNASPWNRIEAIVNASSSSGEDQTDQLTSAATARLEEGRFDVRVSFKVLQISSTYYGKHYSWGDLVTVVFKNRTFEKKIVEVRVTVSQSAKGESIKVKFADK